MKKRTWAFDLDGCLVGAVIASSLRPLARELLERLRAEGTGVVVWSAGGAAYAERIAKQVGIDELVDAYYSKVRGPDGKWTLDDFPSDEVPILCVDDEPAGIPAEIRALSVPPFLGGDRHDRGLERCFAAIEPRLDR